MGLASGHQDYFACRSPQRLSRYRDFRLTLQHMCHGVECRRMLTQTFAFIESKQGESARAPFQDRPADNGTVLIVHEICEAYGFPANYLTFFLRLLRIHESHVVGAAAQYVIPVWRNPA